MTTLLMTLDLLYSKKLVHNSKVTKVKDIFNLQRSCRVFIFEDLICGCYHIGVTIWMIRAVTLSRTVLLKVKICDFRTLSKTPGEGVEARTQRKHLKESINQNGKLDRYYVCYRQLLRGLVVRNSQFFERIFFGLKGCIYSVGASIYSLTHRGFMYY